MVGDVDRFVGSSDGVPRIVGIWLSLFRRFALDAHARLSTRLVVVRRIKCTTTTILYNQITSDLTFSLIFGWYSLIHRSACLSRGSA
jgi:hypothetical protein